MVDSKALRAKVAAELHRIVSASRNGTDNYYRHSLLRRFVYTDGIKEFCEAGACYWLLDVIGTELAPELLRWFADEGPAQATVRIRCRKGAVSLDLCGDDAGDYRKHVQKQSIFFPDGDWTLLLGVNDDAGGLSTILCLLSEN